MVNVLMARGKIDLYVVREYDSILDNKKILQLYKNVEREKNIHI